MNHGVWPVSLVGILSTAVVFGTDMFFLTVGRPALRLASPAAGTEVMGFFHAYGDARMPIWGVLAILSNLLLGLLTRGGHRGLYLLSVSVLILFVVSYNCLSNARYRRLWLYIRGVTGGVGLRRRNWTDARTTNGRQSSHRDSGSLDAAADEQPKESCSIYALSPRSDE
jgi:hypothetical protein